MNTPARPLSVESAPASPLWSSKRSFARTLSGKRGVQLSQGPEQPRQV